MLANLMLAWCLMAFCVVIHAFGLTMLLRWLRKQRASPRQPIFSAAWVLIHVAGWTILLHLVQIAAWAFNYHLAGALPDLTSSFYFSAVTYTTTGYGDLVLPEDWRLVGGVESLTGILMCGLSTGLFFAVFSSLARQNREGSTPPS